MEYLRQLHKPRTYLLIVGIMSVFFLILLGNLRIIPLRTGDFVFFSVLAFAFALYRPGWAFLFFVAALPLENVNLAPEELGITIRPYQLIAALVIVAVVIRYFSGKLNFRLVKPEWYDWLVVLFTLSGFFSAAFSADRPGSVKLAVIMASFAGIYFLARNFLQDADDVGRILPFALASGLLVISYGIWQNVMFLSGGEHFEVMPGRPNSTFTEAEWLGAYLVLIISMILSVMFFLRLRSYDSSEQISNFKFQILNQFQIYKFQILNYLLLTISLILLIITVSRSAWLGAFAATFMFIFIFFTDLKRRGWRWKETIFLKMKIVASIVASIAIVYIFHLTNFQLFNRVQSTGTGLQKITIACEPNLDCLFPETIENMDQLKGCYCRHINLEDVEKEKLLGNEIREIYRKDPNVQTRAGIYKNSWQEIRKHPIAGIGWGSISDVLGKDGRGVGLNSSNIFLEAWLGTGIIGVLSFVIIWIYALFNSIRIFHFSPDAVGKSVGVFLIISWFGLTVFNLFNAGIFLGFLWVWLAMFFIKIPSISRQE